jgi:hypothetical protein
MISIVQVVARLCVVIGAVAVFLPNTPSYAADSFFWASNTGTGLDCTFTSPCSLSAAIAVASAVTGIGQVRCLGPVDPAGTFTNNLQTDGNTVDVNCPQGFINSLTISSTDQTLRVDGLTMGFPPLSTVNLKFTGSGTLILENCAFVEGNFPSSALDIEPNGALNLVIRNCRISENDAGILLKPAAGGSINATLDHVVITDNAGGGIKLDTTNGPVTVDISNSTISKNSGNGMNAVGGAGGPSMFNIHNSIVAKNGAAGVQVNGATAAVMIDTTLLDSNATGATAVLNGGHMLTYGNNRIVGTAGSGFTGPAALQ